MLSVLRVALRPSRSIRYHSTVKAINSFEAFKTEISSEKLTLVDFYATWCGPCKAISPYIEKLAKDYENVNFHKVDVDEQPEIAGYCGISAMPTFIFFKDGASLTKVVGANLREIRSVLQQHSGEPKN